MKKLITVFTPTYNRKHTLHKCYESLKIQTCKDFEWLIIDDGSTDDTKSLVNKWIKENNEFKIKYIYQSNMGMHGAHNTAYENIDTELNVCVDSDDYMPKTAIENIVKLWSENKSEKIAGIVALDSYEDGSIIGSKIPKELKKVKLFELYNKYNILGDKKLVYRTDLTKKFPYPIFEGEKYVGLAYKYYKIDEQYDLLTMNEILCIVEYMEDGSSKNMFSQYINNPKGFAFYRLENMKNPRANLKFKFKECIHYVSSSIFNRDINFIKNSNCRILTILAIPLGLCLYGYILKKSK